MTVQELIQRLAALSDQEAVVRTYAEDGNLWEILQVDASGNDVILS